jgi:hypothetical protein
VTNEPDVGAPLATDEPARPTEAAVAHPSAAAVAAVEAPLPYSPEPASAAGQALDAPEVAAGVAQLMAEPFVEGDAAPTVPIGEPSPSVEPATDVRAPEPGANEPSATPERRGSDLEPEDAVSGLTSALDDPDLDMDWRLEDAVESMYRRNRRAELSEPLF